MTLSYSVLYYNYELLKKYNKRPPKTWNELIETGKFILSEERKLNINTNLRVYNGQFDGSIISYIY